MRLGYLGWTTSTNTVTAKDTICRHDCRYSHMGTSIVPPPALAGSIDCASPQVPGAAEPERTPREAKPDRGRSIDFLSEALKAAPDAATAKLIENRIWELWLASGSDTADLLMSRVKQAAEEKDVDLAIRLLDAIVELKPDYAEAWNR